MPVSIRQLELGDYQGLRNVDIQTQIQYLGDKWHQLTSLGQEEHLVSRKSEFHINLETGYCFVAIQDTQVVGFVLAHETLPFKDTIFIRHIAILPALQSQGVGTQLVNAVIAKAKDSGIKKIWSLINTDNPPSIKLHQKLGFKLNDRKEATIEMTPDTV